MRKALVLIFVLLSLVVGATASASQLAIDTWNQLCGSHNFAGYPQGRTATFHDAYYGSNFEADFAAILSELNGVCSIRTPIVGDDLLDASLESL